MNLTVCPACGGNLTNEQKRELYKEQILNRPARRKPSKVEQERSARNVAAYLKYKAQCSEK